MNNKRLLLATVVALLWSAAGFTQEGDVELTDVAGRGKVGTTGFQFLKIGVGARAVGMGEAFTAMVNDISAVYYNPAGLAVAPQRAAMLTHIEWPADINYEFAAGVLPVASVGVLGAYVGFLSTGDIKRTVPFQGWTGGYFSANDWVVGLTYSRRLTDKFSFGGSIKYLQENLGDDSANNFAMDLGTLFDIGVQGLKFGMSITNFGPNQTYIRDQFALPINFKLGFVVDVFRNEGAAVVASFDGSHPNDNVEQLAFGAEYSVRQRFFLRGGYRTNVELEKLDKVEEPFEGFAFGAGANFNVSTWHAQLDYSYSDYGFLNNAQRFSLMFKF